MEATDLFYRDKYIRVFTRYQRAGGCYYSSWVEAADLVSRDKNITVFTRYKRGGGGALLLLPGGG